MTKLIEDLLLMRRYWREVNGRDDCKNCGLTGEMVEEIIKKILDAENTTKDVGGDVGQSVLPEVHKK